MKRIHRILIQLVLIIGLFIPMITQADELSNVIDQADLIFIKPNGWTYDQMASRRTPQLAMIFGFIIRTQHGYVNQNPSLNKDFDRLKRQVYEYLGQVIANAQVKSDFDGSRITREKLWKICTASFTTTGNDNFSKMMFKVDPAKLQLPNFLAKPTSLEGGLPTGHDIFPDGLPKVDKPMQRSQQRTDSSGTQHKTGNRNAKGKLQLDEPKSISLLGQQPGNTDTAVEKEYDGMKVGVNYSIGLKASQNISGYWKAKTGNRGNYRFYDNLMGLIYGYETSLPNTDPRFTWWEINIIRAIGEKKHEYLGTVYRTGPDKKPVALSDIRCLFYLSALAPPNDYIRVGTMDLFIGGKMIARGIQKYTP